MFIEFVGQDESMINIEESRHSIDADSIESIIEVKSKIPQFCGTRIIMKALITGFDDNDTPYTYQRTYFTKESYGSIKNQINWTDGI